ncbi:MAG TPA: ABC transporter ATP-binding protein [Phycicoccus sp.]|nr:ABC transporter ATP-binding protein [Phycicoccus sp.]
MSTDDVVHIAGLVKDFGQVRALDGLDLDVRRGEVHGFLGPNGAGKSTTIRVLLGLARADRGEVRLFDGDPWHDAPVLHARLAYVPGDVSLWGGLTGGQCLDVLAAARGGLDERRRARLLDRFDLDPTKRARDYSKGNRQKVALVAALATDAELLVLDEPTSGLDPLMEQAFQEVVRERRDEGVTVLLSSHILAEVEALADRVSIIRHGRTVTSGSLADLRRHTRTTVHAVTATAPDALEGMPGVADHVAEHLDGHVDTRFSIDPAHLDEAIGRIHAAAIRTLTVQPPSLDALFLSTYEDDRDIPHGDGRAPAARRARGGERTDELRGPSPFGGGVHAGDVDDSLPEGDGRHRHGGMPR